VPVGLTKTANRALAAPAIRSALSGSKNLFVPKMMYQILTFGRLTTAKMQQFALNVAPPERCKIGC
jgi:hypothetical protein